MSERAGAARPSADPTDSLQALQRRSEELMQEYERNQRTLADTLAASADVRGTGDAEDGAVTVVLDADHRLLELELDPRALRLGSIGALEQAIKDAFDAASDDVQRQLKEAGRGGEPDDDPVRSFLDRMPEINALLPEGLTDRLLADPPPAKDGPRRSGSSGFWKDTNPYE